jgi:hypothetical protein
MTSADDKKGVKTIKKRIQCLACNQIHTVTIGIEDRAFDVTQIAQRGETTVEYTYTCPITHRQMQARFMFDRNEAINFKHGYIMEVV